MCVCVRERERERERACVCVCTWVSMLIPHCICALLSDLQFCVAVFRFIQDLLILFANFYKKCVCLCVCVCMWVSMFFLHCICALVAGLHFCVDILWFMPDVFFFFDKWKINISIFSHFPFISMYLLLYVKCKISVKSVTATPRGLACRTSSFSFIISLAVGGRVVFPPLQSVLSPPKGRVCGDTVGSPMQRSDPVPATCQSSTSLSINPNKDTLLRGGGCRCFQAF